MKILEKGITVDKPLNARFEIGDYLMYHKEGDYFYNLRFAQHYEIEWNPKKIIGYVAKDEINYNNTHSDKMTMIELDPIDPRHIEDYHREDENDDEQ